MERTDNKEVSAAFEIVLEAVESEVNELNNLGGEAFKKRDYQRAKELAEKAEKIAGFRMKILGLSSDWKELNAILAPLGPEPKAKLQRKNWGKLGRGMRTPEEAYYRPIIEVLVELGGSGEMNKVLEKMYPKLAGLLKPVDHQPLATGPRTNLRWRNTAQWARNTLKEHGYLKSDSPHGVWEVADAGRNWLERAKARGDEVTL